MFFEQCESLNKLKMDDCFLRQILRQNFVFYLDELIFVLTQENAYS